MKIILRKTASSMAVVALTMGLASAPAYADKDTARAIAGIVALGVLGAAIANEQHSRGQKEYKAHPRLHADENAVGRCMHRAKVKVRKAGGFKAKLNHVKSIRVTDNGATHVNMVITGYYDFGHKTSDVRCVTKNNKISSFRYD